MNKHVPTFMGIGAQKAGTAWLTKHLRKHPEIWMSPVKELHFFDRSPRYPSPNTLATASPVARMLGGESWERPQVAAGLKTIVNHLKAGNVPAARWWGKMTFGYYDEDWYSGLFSQAVSYEACGEITPAYSILEMEDVARIKGVNPHINIIYLIRNPIERAWSAIRYNVSRGREINLDSDDAIISELQKPGMVLRGDYERTLEIYLGCLESRQILVCFYDAIMRDPVGLMSGITAFLGVCPLKESVIDGKTRVNASPARAVPSRVKEYLVDTYAPMIERLARRFGSYATEWSRESFDCFKVPKAYSTSQLPPVLHP